jgi:hypothetical protein
MRVTCPSVLLYFIMFITRYLGGGLHITELLIIKIQTLKETQGKRPEMMFVLVL